MEYVKQIDKYTLMTTKELTTEPVYYAVDNMTDGKIHSINKSLWYMHPSLDNLELILAFIDHDCSNLKEPKDISEYLMNDLAESDNWRYKC